MTDTQNAAAYELVVAFPDPSPCFVHGFEAGQIYEHMLNPENPPEIERTTHVENREVLERLAIASGWRLERQPSGTEGWDYTKLTKAKPPLERPNPHGLRIVS